MGAKNVGGWLCVNYGGHDVSLVEIGYGDPPVWKAAFLDWNGSERVAKIPMTEDIMPGHVRLRVDGRVVTTDRFLG